MSPARETGDALRASVEMATKVCVAAVAKSMVMAKAVSWKRAIGAKNEREREGLNLWERGALLLVGGEGEG